MKAYALTEGAKFGYRQVFNANLKHQNYLANGKVCKSMLAVPVSNYTAVCASFNYSTTDGQPTCTPFQLNKKNITVVSQCTMEYNQG